jgi:hypothetical protein
MSSVNSSLFSTLVISLPNSRWFSITDFNSPSASPAR